VSTSNYQIYCHEDARCSLKVAGQEKLQRFEDVSQAIHAAIHLKHDESESLLTVYNALGSLVFQILV
jgi:hypothetical protein